MERHEFTARNATIRDASSITEIYNFGISERVATFETRPRSVEEIKRWFDSHHPVVVVVDGNETVCGFASTSKYRERECYAGIAEFSVYVAAKQRGKGIGRLAMSSLIEEAKLAGFWKLLSRVFVENAPSLRLLKSLGFREVGTYERHGKLDGVWRDVVIVEKIL